jgi:hypothetical protein
MSSSFLSALRSIRHTSSAFLVFSSPMSRRISRLRLQVIIKKVQNAETNLLGKVCITGLVFEQVFGILGYSSAIADC